MTPVIVTHGIMAEAIWEHGLCDRGVPPGCYSLLREYTKEFRILVDDCSVFVPKTHAHRPSKTHERLI